MSEVRIVEAAAVDFAVVEGRWPFAEEHRGAIADYFDRLKAANPAFYNDPMFMLAEWSLAAGTFRGRFWRTDFASFIYWRDHGFADPAVKNGFGAGAMFTSDGALVLGRMADHTANGGKIYPPAGSLEKEDVTPTGTIDVEANIVREIAEETGLDVAGRFEVGWFAVLDGPRLPLVRPIRLALDAAEVSARIARHLEGEARPELAGIHLVRGRGDIVAAAMPPYTQAFIRHVFGR